MRLVDPGRDERLLETVADITFAAQPEWSRSVAFLLASFTFDADLQRRLALVDEIGRAHV